jgi:acylphosphatase
VLDNRSATIVLPVSTAPSRAAANTARKGDRPRCDACTERNRTTIEVTNIGPDGIDWASFRHHNGVTDGADEGTVRLTAWVHGTVQGVGFRWWTRGRALQFGLVGSARNLSDGRVEVVAEGPRAGCERLLAALRSDATPGRVRTVVDRWTEARGGLRGFATR